MTMDFEEVKAFMKTANGNGDSLYEHLTNVLLKINRDKPADAMAQLEAISVSVKNFALTPTLYKELPTVPKDPQERQRQIAALKATLALFRAVPNVTAADRTAVEASLRALAAAAAEDEEDGGKAAADALLPACMKGPAIPNLLGASNMLETAGVSLGKEEMYRISLSIKILGGTNSNFISLRFFGKLFGTGRDYYVVEAKLANAPKEKEDKATKKEPRGVSGSINEFVYYVTNSLEGEWTELPDVLPEQIVTARKMCRFFTGNVNAPVKGYPRFPWPECSFLRAQIARISAATTISPKGFFTMEEPEGDDEDAPEEMKADPEFEALGAEDLATTEGWAHHRSHILKMGRCKKWEPPENEDEEEEEPAEEEEEEEEEEEGLPPLSGLEGDESTWNPVMWKFGAFGGQHATTSVTSMEWPGAVAVAKGKAFANIYIGWGQKQTGRVFTPPALPPVNDEYKSGFNPEEAEEDETDPSIEQVDPLPPKDLDEDGDGEGDEGDEDDDY